MEKIDPFQIYEIGAAIERLKLLCENCKEPHIDHLLAISSVKLVLAKLLQGDPVEISYCRDAAENFFNEFKFVKEQLDQKVLDPDSKIKIPEVLFFQIKQAAELFEHQFSAELRKLGTYMVPAVGIFDTEKLVESAEAHIHESIKESLPDFAISEYSKAGRCLAFGLYSASGYHSARAVESVLRKYYEIYVDEPKKDTMGLGEMAKNLDEFLEKNEKEKEEVDTQQYIKEKINLPQKSIVRHLLDFSKLDRNPLIHANEELDLEQIDALTLFNTALSAIVEMGKVLAEKENKTPPLGLYALGQTL